MSESDFDERNIPRSVKVVAYFVLMLGSIPILIFGSYLIVREFIRSLPDDTIAIDPIKDANVLRIEDSVDAMEMF